MSCDDLMKDGEAGRESCTLKISGEIPSFISLWTWSSDVRAEADSKLPIKFCLIMTRGGEGGVGVGPRNYRNMLIFFFFFCFLSGLTLSFNGDDLCRLRSLC